MRKIILIFTVLLSLTAVAQPDNGKMPPGNGAGRKNAKAFNPENVAQFNIIMHTDNNIPNKLKAGLEQQNNSLTDTKTRGFFNDVWQSLRANASTASTTTISGLASTGAMLIAELFRSKKSDWTKLVQRENKFTKELFMLQDVNDFYSDISTQGALDPSFMTFDGFECIQMRGEKMVLKLSCHLKTDSLSMMRIIRHSKFELELDELYFNPEICDLPNDSTQQFSEREKFSFENRQNLNLRIDADLTSSWINQAIQVYNDQLLGQFYVQVPINKEDLNSEGVFYYKKGSDDNKKDVEIIGESFVVPRSYMGFLDGNGNYVDGWGTGQYKMTLRIKETCNITPEFEANWKTDWKHRKKQRTRPLQKMWQNIVQTWDNNKQQWITSIIEAPATYVMKDIGLIVEQQKSGGLGGASGKSGGVGAMGGSIQKGGDGKTPQKGVMPGM